MEQYAYKDATLYIFREVLEEEEFRDWPDAGIALQAYLRDCAEDLEALAHWVARRGTPVWVRLVKGAYWDYETILAGQQSWPVPVFTQKGETDANYQRLTRFLMEHHEILQPAIASHNIRSLAYALSTGMPARGRFACILSVLAPVFGCPSGGRFLSPSPLLDFKPDDPVPLPRQPARAPPALVRPVGGSSVRRIPMAKLKLSMISARNERTEALTDSIIDVEGVEIVHTYSDPSETFWRQLNFWEYEISEMSLSSYLIAKSNGADMIMVPVFPSRSFMHANLSYHVDSGVEGPEDLEGKSIGVGD